MSKIILSYPDGVAGAALLMMRLSSGFAAWAAFTQISQRSDHWLTVIAYALVAVALIAGIFTRLVAVLLVTAIVACIVSDARGMLSIWLSSAGGTAALALMGPGAFSIDAHRYGRRVISLTPRSPDRGGKD